DATAPPRRTRVVADRPRAWPTRPRADASLRSRGPRAARCCRLRATGADSAEIHVQRLDDAECRVVARLAAVDDDEREERFGTRMGWNLGRFCDQAETAPAPAAESREAREQPPMQRQVRHGVAVQADDQPSVLALRIEREHTIVRVVGATRRAESAEHAP